MAHLLFIVSREEPGRYTYLKHVFASRNGDVIVDRRVAERRRRKTPVVAVEKRREDRRDRDITKDLQTSGWALVMC